MQDSAQNTFNSLVAVFPLPDIAALPGEVIPLHIFEPRYRRMIDDIVKNEYLLGVSLAGKVLHAPEIHRNEDPTKRNLTLYEPNTIFGCGPVIIKERLADGRVAIELHILHKVEITDLVQTLPYYLSSVRPISDERCDQRERQSMTKKLEADFIQLARSIDINAAMTLAKQTDGLDLDQLIAFILGVIRFPGDFKQQLLEQNQSVARAQILLNKLPELFPHITH